MTRFFMASRAQDRVSTSAFSFRTRVKSAGPAFDVNRFLDSTGVARRVIEYRESETIYSQGNPTRGVKYIQKGGVRLSLVNEVGKEAVVAILGPGDFFGEGCLAGQPVCMERATAIVPPSILFIEKTEIIRVPHEEPGLSDRFIVHILARK